MSITNIPIGKYVDVEIVKTVTAFNQVDFGLLCLVSERVDVIPVNTRYKIYNTLADVGVDFATTDPEYIFAQTFFSQNALDSSPKRIMISVVDIPLETYPEAIAAAYAAQVFYGLAVVNLSLSSSVILAIAAYVQSQKMLFFSQSSDVNILDTGSTSDIAYLLQAANYTRTALTYVESTNTSRIDAALSGMGLPGIVGSFNWAWKLLNGVTPTNATSSEQDAGTAKSCNFYIQVGGSSVMTLGVTSGTAGGSPAKSSSYIDEITGIDWLQINMQLDVYNLLISTPKISFTDTGVASIVAAVANRLDIGIRNDIIADTPPYQINTIPVAQVPVIERAARTYNYVTFTANLSGALNYIQIRGRVSA